MTALANCQLRTKRVCARKHKRSTASGRASIVLILALAIAWLLPAGPSLAAPGHSATAGAPIGPGSQAILARHIASLQTSTDDDELQDLRIAPLDPTLPPGDILRRRPFVLSERSVRAFPYDLRGADPLSTAEARARLERFLALRELEPSTIQSALDRFDSRSVRRIIPSPTLRAATLMLTGWRPYETTIRAILEGENPSGKPYRAVMFDDIGFPGAIATLYEDPRDGRASLVVSQDYAGEDPEQLIPVIVHESLHGGGDNSAEEEIAANILDTLCYAEVLLVDPGAAYLGTDLTVFNNLELLALLNSMGRGGPARR